MLDQKPMTEEEFETLKLYDPTTGRYSFVYEQSRKELKLYELVQRYHAETEAFDRTVCTRVTNHETFLPANSLQRGLSNNYAFRLLKKLEIEAIEHEITPSELKEAIRSHYPKERKPC